MPPCTTHCQKPPHNPINETNPWPNSQPQRRKNGEEKKEREKERQSNREERKNKKKKRKEVKIGRRCSNNDKKKKKKKWVNKEKEGKVREINNKQYIYIYIF